MTKSLSSFLRSACGPVTALSFFRENPSLLPHAMLPLVLNLLVGVFALWLAFFGLSDWLPIALPAFEWSWAGAWAFVTGLFISGWNFIVHTIIFLMIYALCFPPVCSFFYGLFVEKVENTLGIAFNEKKTPPIMIQILDSLFFGFLVATLGLVALLFSFLPFLGLPFMLLVLLLQAACLGMEFFDFPLSLRGLVFINKLHFFRQQIPAVFGTGLVALVFAPIPVLNSCLFTLCILGATFETRRLYHQKRMAEILGDGNWRPVGFSGHRALLRLSDPQGRELLNIENGTFSPVWDGKAEQGDLGQFLFVAEKADGTERCLFSEKGLIGKI
jgi:uncharacterized protein involved in cysteine biosynthesis